jgi:hypothetical protein
MNNTLKLAFAVLLIMTSQSFFAQKIVTSNRGQEIVNKKAEKHAKKSSDAYHAKLDDEQAKLNEQQSKIKKDQKE